jgi:hypothetical protein
MTNGFPTEKPDSILNAISLFSDCATEVIGEVCTGGVGTFGELDLK